MGQENMLEAENIEIQGIIIFPKSEITLMLEVGYLYMEMKMNDEAEAVFSGVAFALPHSDIPRVALGNLCFSKGQFQRALKHHKEALKVNSESQLAKAHIGESLLFLKKYEEAKQVLQDAVQMNPETQEALFAGALLVMQESGELELAR